MKYILTILISTILMSCDEVKKDIDYKASFDHILECKTRQYKIDNFTIPDSIDKSLIIATYHDIHTEEHCVLVFDDTIKKLATKITFRFDSSYVTDKLIKVKFNEFTSMFDSSLYVIKPDLVAWTYQSGCLAYSVDNLRTDKNAH